MPHYDPDNVPGSEMLVNISTTGDQSLHGLDDGSWVVAWSGSGNGDNAGIYQQRFVPNQAPTDMSLSSNIVSEGAATGTVVGTLVVSDPDHTASHPEGFTFTLLDDAGGRFALSGNTLVVAGGAAFDDGHSKSQSVVVRVTDSAGHTFDKIIGLLMQDSRLGHAAHVGKAGQDIFVFDTKLAKTNKANKKQNVDKISDFTVKDDAIWLDNAIFKKLGKGSEAKPGALKKAFFTIGDKAKDANDYLIYNKKNGGLFYDADGSGAKEAIQFASLSKNLKLTYKDFFVI